MKKINLRNPLAIYCLTLASLIFTIGIIYVIVDVNSKLAPDKQILFSPDEEKENEDKHFLKVSVWEHSGEKVVPILHELSISELFAMHHRERYSETFLKKGEIVRIGGAERFTQNGTEHIGHYYNILNTGVFIAYADAELTVKSCVPTPYWGEPCGIDEFTYDKLNYPGIDIRRRGSLMIEASIKDLGDDYIVGQTDESGHQLDYLRSKERLCDVDPKISGSDAYTTRDVFAATLEFLAYSRTDPEKVIAFAKLKITDYQIWKFKDVTDIDGYYYKLKELGLQDDLDNYPYTTAELIDYWESDDLR